MSEVDSSATQNNEQQQQQQESKEEKVEIKFKKNPNKKPIRKRTNEVLNELVTDGQSTEQPNEEDLKLILELTKEKQKMREKGKGVNIGILSEGPHHKVSLREIDSKLDDSFTLQEEKKEVNLHLEKYIEEQLKQSKQQQQQISNITSTSTNTTTSSSSTTSMEKDYSSLTVDHDNLKNSLYETPEHLKTTSSIKVSDTDKTNWVAGIAEVPLSDSYKVKNIIETEKARTKIMEDKYTNKANNYNNTTHKEHHRYMNTKKSKGDKATDEEVFEHFKKRFRY
ncbi:hypothetical protein DLAC_01308 [Tieghemostelium lacteum]|uniref:Uncharacterized protein n=1 Tax=Tieghemostelium lacteum TaxID=361077 RepID=A0A152A8T2_TIELA|nr:hypothetical protein DLAC_01308 [Tieghemostelium lacteum]|eukprot:KYR02467.1 hypothetical protein DLAC_01308 [Tieghemostelium lacteum]